ncbi:related to Protein CCC1 [Hanseniaspora guilliermondii]|uniref:Related to Protein CCC1 n=1 Tax=Hanseniaspora guilliermondii TaxID=56406 RepID=A0A1L0B4T2_9ASCO|nr:related to Protein CCC1 [Hanseniaspora guilliermondii]
MSEQTPLVSNNNNNNNRYESIKLPTNNIQNSGNTSSNDQPHLSNNKYINVDEESLQVVPQQKSVMDKLVDKVDPRVMSDLIIGLSDGLTVPFALTAGLSSLGDSKLVLLGGFAELISGTISMGLGGYLGAKSEEDYYKSEVKIEKQKFYDTTNNSNENSSVNEEILHEIEDILADINPNFKEDTILQFMRDLSQEPEKMVDFVIKYGKGLEEPDENRAYISALTIGAGYLSGGMIPLLPYFFTKHVGTGLIYSVIIMLITLFIFGYVKTILTMSDAATLEKKIKEGFQMILVGSIAAGSAWFFVKVLDG